MGTDTALALPRLWTSDDVADWLHLPARRVEKLARGKAIPSITLPGGELVFDPAELARWLDGLRQRGGAA
jgi:hypothetical protein